MTIDTQALRRELYEAINTVVTKYEKLGQSITKDGLAITPAEVLQQPYTHRWPWMRNVFTGKVV